MSCRVGRPGLERFQHRHGDKDLLDLVGIHRVVGKLRHDPVTRLAADNSEGPVLAFDAHLLNRVDLVHQSRKHPLWFIGALQARVAPDRGGDGDDHHDHRPHGKDDEAPHRDCLRRRRTRGTIRAAITTSTGIT